MHVCLPTQNYAYLEDLILTPPPPPNISLLSSYSARVSSRCKLQHPAALECGGQAGLAHRVRLLRQGGPEEQHSRGERGRLRTRPAVELRCCLPQVRDRASCPHAVLLPLLRLPDAEAPGTEGSPPGGGARV